MGSDALLKLAPPSHYPPASPASAQLFVELAFGNPPSLPLHPPPTHPPTPICCLSLAAAPLLAHAPALLPAGL
jgi:hypothetical protein